MKYIYVNSWYHIANNHMGDAGMTEIAKALKVNTIITKLYIGKQKLDL